MDKVQKVKINEKKWPLKVTLGFWKQCGFTIDQSQIVASDPEKGLQALKLAVFYGSKKDYGWDNLDDMSKVLKDSDFESIDEDFSEELSMAMVDYLPPKMKALVKKRIQEAMARASDMINDMEGNDVEDEKDIEGIDPSNPEKKN